MEYFGMVACVLLIMHSGIPAKVKKLERNIRVLERKLNEQSKLVGVTDASKSKEEKIMSRLLEECKGKRCIVDSDELEEENVFVCDVDEEWVKVEYKERKRKGEEETKVMLIRTESITSVEILADKY